MAPDAEKLPEMNKKGFPVLQKVIESLPSPPPSLKRSFRGRCSGLTPWVLLALQSVIVIFLLAQLQINQKKLHLPAKCPKCEEVRKCVHEEDNLSIDELVRASHVDERVQKELPVTVPENVPRIFYNRVPKCGSSTMMDLMTEMGRLHNFTFIRDGVFMTFYLQEPWRKRFARRMFSYEPPVIYERHFHFLDFTQYSLKQPVYINLVRDPLDRLVSWYYFRRFQEGHIRDMPTAKRVRTYDECVLGNHTECVDPLGDEAEEGYFKIIPFFCGQESFCRQPGERALLQAIQNVKYHYSVVGYIEDYQKFTEVLEYVLPSYFTGAPKVFKYLENEWHKNHKTTYKLPISKEVISIMEKKLKEEYQFYSFIRNRFKKLHSAIVQAEGKLHRK